MKQCDRLLVQISVIMMSCAPWISVQPETELTSIHKAITGPHVYQVCSF